MVQRTFHWRGRTHVLAALRNADGVFELAPWSVDRYEPLMSPWIDRWLSALNRGET